MAKTFRHDIFVFGHNKGGRKDKEVVVLPDVYCSVDNCHYWSQGNVCKASQILVATDSWAEQASEAIDASSHMEVPTASADTCMETCCKTFVPEGSASVEVDGTTRK
jgi:hypothetical protein